MAINGTTVHGQSISDVSFEGDMMVLSVPIFEMIANFTVAANQAERENMHDTARRLRNDCKVLGRCLPGDLVRLT